MSAIHEILADPNMFVEPRKRYTVEGDHFNVNFMADDRSRVFIAVTLKSYPERVTFVMIEEMQSKFLEKCGEKALTSKEGALDKTSKSIFKEICAKYSDLAQVDRVSAVAEKVESVKSTMQDNIAQMLENAGQLDDIQNSAENLSRQAEVFNKRSNQLRRNMRCRDMKMKFVIAGAVVLMLIIIIVPLSIMLKNKD